MKRRNNRRPRLECLENRRVMDATGLVCVAEDAALVPLAAEQETSLRLMTQSEYLPGVPLLIRVQVEGTDGRVDRAVWRGEVGLTAVHGDLGIADTTVQLFNGMGSVLVTPVQDGSLTLTVHYAGEEIARTLTSRGSDVTELAGTLTGQQTLLSGTVRVTDDVVVPAGHRLHLAPGTIVLVDGSSRSEGLGHEIRVEGELTAQGSMADPVVFTAAHPDRPWAEVDVNGGQAQLSFVQIHRAGNGERGGHTGTGPAVRVRNGGQVELQNSSVTDLDGKVMQSSDGHVTMHNTLLSRAVMGPEINNTSLLFRDSWIVDMAGRFHHSGEVDDNDGIYLHSQQTGQNIHLVGGVIAGVQDDGIDTLGSDVLVEDFIVTDADDKAVSVFDGETTLRRTLLVNASIGVETKGAGRSRPRTNIDQTTIANVDWGIRAFDKGSPDPNVVITYNVTNSIIDVRPRGTAVSTDYQPEDLRINYSLLPVAWTAPGSGTGNIVAAPQFVDPASHDFRLLPTSPAIDAGDTAAPLDPDGTRADMGYFAFRQTPPGDVNGDGRIDSADIDQLWAAVHAGEYDRAMDLNGDGQLTDEDVRLLVQDRLGTTWGDANLDGVFNSSDLVRVFQAGEYEDALPDNSSWASGDWNGDGDFTTADLVLAFQGGGYVPGARLSH